MIATTFESISVFLLSHEPDDWDGGVDASFDKLTKRTAGLSNREERVPLAAALRCTSLKFKSVLTSAQADDLRSTLADWDNRPILCPFWPAESLIGSESTASVQGALRVWYEPDWSDWEIGTGVAPVDFTPSANCLTAPLLWGRFDSFPEQRIMTGSDDEQVSWSLVENGSVAHALTSRSLTLTMGVSVNGESVPLMTPTFAWGANTETVEVKIERKKIGLGRGDVDTFVAQEPRTKHVLTFDWLKDSASPAYLLHLFDDRDGSVSPWWAIAAHSTTDRAFGRFFSDRISLKWTRPHRCGGEHGVCKVEFLTLPTEEDIPDGETFGESIGPKAGEWEGYVISDGTNTWRVTSYESAIDAGGLGVFEPRPIDHGDMTMELNLERHDVSLTVGWWDGSPFEILRLDRFSPQLTVQIFKGPIASPSSAALIITGRVREPKFSGETCSCMVAGPDSLFDQKGPIAVTSPRCWVPLYSPLCGLDRASLAVSASLLSINDDGSLAFDLDGSGLPADYFRFGYAERPQADGTVRRFRIMTSSVFAAGVTIPPLGTVESETSDWEAAVAAAGGTLGTYSKRIANNLVAILKGKSYYSKIKYLMPLLGSDLDAALTPLIDPTAAGRPLSTGFGDDDFTESGGLLSTTGDSGPSLRVLKLPFKPSDLGTSNAGGFGFWLMNPLPAGGPVLIGMAPLSYSTGYQLVAGAGARQVRWGSILNRADAGSPGLPANYYGQGGATRELFENGLLIASNSTTDAMASANLSELRAWGQFIGDGGLHEVSYAMRGGVLYLTDGTMGPDDVADLHSVLRSELMILTHRIGSTQGITVDRPLDTEPTFPEEGWVIYPGCNKSYTRCRSLGNQDNFRSFPRFPKTNPALIPIKQETAVGGKK